MLKKLKTIATLFWMTLEKWQHDNGSLVAAGLSFFAIFSLAPVILITIAVMSWIFEQSRARHIVLQNIALTTSVDTAQTIDALLQSVLESAGKVSLMSTLVLLWVGSRIFSELQHALNNMWKTEPEKSGRLRKIVMTVFKRLHAVAVTFLLGSVLIVFTFIDIGLAALQHFLSSFFSPILVKYVWPLASLSASLALFTLIFALIYKWLPQARIHWKDAGIGAGVGASLFTAGRYFISLYFRYYDVSSPFGAAGSVILILLWIYFSMQIFLFGAEFTWVISRERQRRQTGPPYG